MFSSYGHARNSRFGHGQIRSFESQRRSLPSLGYSHIFFLICLIPIYFDPGGGGSEPCTVGRIRKPNGDHDPIISTSTRIRRRTGPPTHRRAFPQNDLRAPHHQPAVHPAQTFVGRQQIIGVVLASCRTVLRARAQLITSNKNSRYAANARLPAL